MTDKPLRNRGYEKDYGLKGRRGVDQAYFVWTSNLPPTIGTNRDGPLEVPRGSSDRLEKLNKILQLERLRVMLTICKNEK